MRDACCRRRPQDDRNGMDKVSIKCGEVAKGGDMKQELGAQRTSDSYITFQLLSERNSVIMMVGDYATTFYKRASAHEFS